MTITFPVYQLASFDEEKAAWILEGGTYGIWVGSSIQDAEPAGSLCLNKDAVLVQCEHICPLKEELKELTETYAITAQQAGTVRSVSLTSKDDTTSKSSSDSSAGSGNGDSSTGNSGGVTGTAAGSTAKTAGEDRKSVV